MTRVLLAVAHGSRDPAAQECVLSLTGRVARSAGGIAVRTAFVQNAKPSLAEGLDEAATHAGPDGVVVVPLLLSSGYHLSSDIAGAARAAGVPVARPRGPDPRLVRALSDRLRGSTGTWISGPIGDHPAVAELIQDRFRDRDDTATAARSLRLAAARRSMANWTGGAHGDRRKSA